VRSSAGPARVTRARRAPVRSIRSQRASIVTCKIWSIPEMHSQKTAVMASVTVEAVRRRATGRKPYFVFRAGLPSSTKQASQAFDFGYPRSQRPVPPVHNASLPPRSARDQAASRACRTYPCVTLERWVTSLQVRAVRAAHACQLVDPSQGFPPARGPRSMHGAQELTRSRYRPLFVGGFPICWWLPSVVAIVNP
jgi:hypothetical protein